MPLQATSGAASYDAFGGGVPYIPQYIEEVFSTWLYTGTGSPQTITNGIDLAGKGGMVWQKSRNSSGFSGDHTVADTNRNNLHILFPNLTDPQESLNPYAVLFNSNGFTAGNQSSRFNQSNQQMASWTFRKQPKFFDVVTWSGNSTAGRSIAHNLGSVPGCIIIKSTNNTPDWHVWHRELTSPLKYLSLNTTDPAYSGSQFSSSPDSSSFYLTASGLVNQTGQTYVAYLFAHDAGGFGLTGTDNVISCGSFTTDGSGVANVTLGYEPQWILVRESATNDNWRIFDSMRGWNLTTADKQLNPNLSDAESNESIGEPTATGFRFQRGASKAHIYIAIRRGPMKVPTTGTSVFEPNNTLVNSGPTKISTTFPVDLVMTKGSLSFSVFDRLRGAGRVVNTGATNSEVGLTASNWQLDFMDGFEVDSNDIDPAKPHYAFRRAPSVFDEVCYTGTGTIRNQTHNLGAAPELIIVKRRDATGNWRTRHKDFFGSNDTVSLNTTTEKFPTGMFTDEGTTSTTFPIANDGDVNASGGTYVAYLFATCPGVSKVGSYTGNGTTQAIACGFTGGARFVLIKRTDATGDWYVYDTARGMTVLADPFLLLNSTAAETATLGSVITSTGGFTVNAAILAAINTNAASYIFLAIS